MPHIVHLTTVHLPFDTRIFRKECRSLVQAGYRVSLIAPHTSREVVDGVEIVPVPRFARRSVRMTWGVWATYRLARKLQPDLVHFHDPELMPVGVLLKLTTPAQVVYDVHEDYASNLQGRVWLPRALRGIASVSVRGIESVGAKLMDGVVAATKHIGEQFPAEKTIVVRNYPLLPKAHASLGELRAYAGNYELIYTGGVTTHRGIDQIVRALEHVETPQARLTLLGRELDQGLAIAIKGMPGYNRVDYRGHVPFETMIKHLNAAAVGLLCNQPRYGYDLALPNKLFEYMSAGLPVIASHFPAWQEIVEGSECGVTVDPTDPRAIARAIDNMLGQPERRRIMGQNAQRAVRQQYNWDHESRKLLGLYEEVLR